MGALGRQLEQAGQQTGILYAVAALLTKLGGPVRSVPYLAEAVALEGFRCALASQSPWRSKPGANLLPDQRLVHAVLARGFEWNRMRTVISPAHRHTVAAAIRHFRPEIIHDNGLWLPANHNIAVLARSANIRRVVSPRGALDSWSLDQSSRLKRVAMSLFQRRDLESADAFMVTSEEEAESVRRIGLAKPIAVVPNGVHLPELPTSGSTEQSQRPTPRIALFLSRIHPKKGIELLLDAWQSVSPNEWQLKIVGPSDPEYLTSLRQRAEKSGSKSPIKFLPEASEVEKDLLYRQADLFVLPSHQENFGIVIAEAMSYGIPVITTTATPWRNLDAASAGWCIPVTLAALEQVLSLALSLPREELRRRGKNGRAIIEREFGWPHAGRKAAQFYRWLLAPNQNERPTHVI